MRAIAVVGAVSLSRCAYRSPAAVSRAHSTSHNAGDDTFWVNWIPCVESASLPLQIQGDLHANVARVDSEHLVEIQDCLCWSVMRELRCRRVSQGTQYPRPGQAFRLVFDSDIAEVVSDGGSAFVLTSSQMLWSVTRSLSGVFPTLQRTPGTVRNIQLQSTEQGTLLLALVNGVSRVASMEVEDVTCGTFGVHLRWSN